MNIRKLKIILIVLSLVYFKFLYANKVPLEKLSQVREEASIALENKDFEKAFEAYSYISIQYPDDLLVANDMAVILAGMGRLEEARNILEQAIVNNDTLGSPFLNLREILSRQASISYTKALNRDPPTSVLALKSEGLDAIKRKDEIIISKEKTVDSDKTLPDLGTDVPTSLVENIEEDIKALLLSWSEAWSRKEFDSYISFYSDNFKNKRFKSKLSWSKYRKPRVLKKGTIRVKIVNPRVTMITDDLYEVIFTQKYKSSNLRLSTTKKMRFQKTSGGWKITFEGTN